MAEEKIIIKIPAFEIEIVKSSAVMEEETTEEETTETDDSSNNDTEEPAVDADPDMTDNRNSNGDVVLPYRYTKNGWNILFDLDEDERVTTGRFLLDIIPYATPTGDLPETKLVLENLLLDGKRKFNIYDTSKNTFLEIGSDSILDLKQNFEDRKYVCSIGDWGDNSYIYLFINGHCSGVFYLFPKDTNAGYIREG